MINWNCPEFELDYSGSYFLVLIFNDYVVKIPRKKESIVNNEVEKMAYIQNDLAQKIDGVLPCEFKNNCIIMPKAPGIKVKGIPEEDVKTRERVKRLAEEIALQAKEHKYKLVDLGDKNLFYDEENDKVYFIDFHMVQKRR